ncbi:high-affinity branched-chain amino acid ABC transporter ATP-binding protein LivG [Helicobacter monodelphidis]|uniref:ABC transporter ATP-binding protein n=1 Tax=Helicobacter sp. 15-1451 TaxID=2004995 RepID=UPI000DCE70A8|nr:ABC transporter ATP-binding protein [Helicobacter sp. 15-1451]RAX58863.1 high-affinity branched-chain amino acid ABC transporter ATP-binding protein LivG [Helicobacter sp. 15-1451]
MKALEVCNVTKQFGGLKAIDSVSFEIMQGEIFGLIGPNGAGKTTMFNLITANIPATNGHILLGNEEITHCKPNQIVTKGIARTFQNIRLFESMNVLENVLIGLHTSTQYSFLEAAFRCGRFFSQEKQAKQKALEILEYIGIVEFAQHNAKALSYGNQRKVEIARALSTQPKLLLLDEPAAGMNPKETEDLASLIFKMRKDFTLSVLLIEHDMPFVNHLCDRVLVLDYGKMLFSGTPKEAINHESVIAAYLGDLTKIQGVNDA